MTDRVAAEQLQAFIERLERMHEERKAIADDIKEIYAEARSNGFDLPAIKAVLKIRSSHESSSIGDKASSTAAPQGEAVRSHGTGAETLAGREERSTGEAVSADLPTIPPETALLPGQLRGEVRLVDNPALLDKLKAALETKNEPPTGKPGTALAAVPAPPGRVVLPPPRPLRPFCLNPARCGGHGPNHCFSCTQAREAAHA